MRKHEKTKGSHSKMEVWKIMFHDVPFQPFSFRGDVQLP